MSKRWIYLLACILFGLTGCNNTGYTPDLQDVSQKQSLVNENQAKLDKATTF